MPLPPFPVEGGPALAAARGMADATLLAAFGALLFRALVAPPVLARAASYRFSPLGTACVLVLAGTAAFQSFVLIGGLPGWVGTAYGLVALLKIALFSALLGFAARNRFRLTPALSGAAPTTAKRDLMRSIAGETAVGLLVVLAAGLLTSLPPAMHVQPLWPFPWRLSLMPCRRTPTFDARSCSRGSLSRVRRRCSWLRSWCDGGRDGS